MGLSRTVSETDGVFSRKLQKFSTPVYIAPPLTGFPLEFGVGAQDQKKLESWATGQRKKFDDILYSAIWIQYTNVMDGHRAAAKTALGPMRIASHG